MIKPRINKPVNQNISKQASHVLSVPTNNNSNSQESDKIKQQANNVSVIEAASLSKVYKLYNRPFDRLKEALNPFDTKYHKDFYALRDINFNIQQGECVGIVGKNGSGKSTLLKIITGVLTPSVGKVMVNGKVAALLELGAGFNPDYTGMENIYFQGGLMGYTHEEITTLLPSILAFADIGEFVHQAVKMYSSGMFMRLAFAIAVSVKPDILIVDEALSVGDVAFQAKCFNKFREFRALGITILFVSHSTDLVIKYCNKALLLHEGNLLKVGTSKDVVEEFRKLMVNSKNSKAINASIANTNIGNTTPSSQKPLKALLPINMKASTYGSLEAEIIDFAVINQNRQVTNQLYHDEDYSIKLVVQFHQSIIDPIFAFTIRTVDGLELTGTNSLYLGHTFEQIKKGEVLNIEFTQKMILNAGQYLLALGCTKYQEDGLKVFHRIYDALIMTVLTTKNGVGVAFAPSYCTLG